MTNSSSINGYSIISLQTITCSKQRIETLEHDMKYAQS